MSGPKKTFYVIDGHAQIFRAYHAIRSLNSPVTGEPTNATFGFVAMLIKLFKEHKPDYLVVTIDVGGDKGTFRNQLDPAYKANRDAPPEDLHPQVERIVELCQAWGIPVIGIEGYEADDVIATLCERHAKNDGLLIRIVSRDKDLQQLLGPAVEMFDAHKDEVIDAARLAEDKGLRPDQIVDFLALMGDNVDNIPGAKGIGPKTASKLIAEFGSLDELLKHTDKLKGKQKENIEAAASRMPLNLELVRLKRDVPFDFKLNDATVTPPPVGALAPLFQQLGFSRHLQDLETLAGATAPPPPPAFHEDAGLFASLESAAPREPAGDYRAITTTEALATLVEQLTAHAQSGGAIAVDTETDRLNPVAAKLCGICLAWKTGEAVYVPTLSKQPEAHLDANTVITALRPVLSDPTTRVIGQNLKYDRIVLRQAGIELSHNSFDTMIASYLLDPTRSTHKLDYLALAFCGHSMIPITQLIGRGKDQKSMADLTVEQVTEYSAEDADFTLRLHDIFAPMLKQQNLSTLFETLEMPLVEVLAELEHNGIRVDPRELERQNAALGDRIEELRRNTLDTAGVDFNPDSPKQLADVLFSTLGCTVIKKKKTGPSTDSEVLQRIADEQPAPGSVLAEQILEYRKLTKLRNTYLESLAEAINPDTGRIHASFNQTVTATGRLSSSDPNLQNIPIRTDLGRDIRKAFVADSGKLLLAADYSQIELRLLAHLSQDPALLQAFRDDLDIHTAVAAEVFEVEPSEVTSEQRGVAKMVNFGIVYGITPYGLARRLPSGAAGSDVAEAKRIIDDYKVRYPKIDAFLEQCVATAAHTGSVETICGRRRPIPEIAASNANLAALGRRMAINTVVQGSAADLIKTAMVNLHRRIRDEKRPMKMLLQIHDELVFEVEADAIETEAAVVRHEMEQAMTLDVPVRVDVAWGQNWYEAK